ncbi:hypothetical protein ADIMK_4000 [Marinobacterium lacunae]|uniref:Uncharacterized protein n=1 Tax=Marinobacterium lacunae TaxID=1232683 RepID=A0A081FTJ8_9GAMM|nr:hypothetical protein [Marinobacterium lacunae]KEA61853.1 hypothetical protein ADIMK_4000 [Marinobacterium lacunae]
MQLIRSEVWRERQRALCDAYDRLMELSDPKDIAQQWDIIELLWKQNSSGQARTPNDTPSTP